MLIKQRKRLSYFTYGNASFHIILSIHLTLSSPLPVSKADSFFILEKDNWTYIAIAHNDRIVYFWGQKLKLQTQGSYYFS